MLWRYYAWGTDAPEVLLPSWLHCTSLKKTQQHSLYYIMEGSTPRLPTPLSMNILSCLDLKGEIIHIFYASLSLFAWLALVLVAKITRREPWTGAPWCRNYVQPRASSGIPWSIGRYDYRIQADLLYIFCRLHMQWHISSSAQSVVRILSPIIHSRVSIYFSDWHDYHEDDSHLIAKINEWLSVLFSCRCLI